MRIEIGTNEKLNFPKFVHALSAYDSAINRTLLMQSTQKGFDLVGATPCGCPAF